MMDVRFIHRHTHTVNTLIQDVFVLQGIMVIILEANVTVKKRITSIFSYYKHAPNSNQIRVFFHHCSRSNHS